MTEITISVGHQTRRDLLRTAGQFLRAALKARRPRPRHTRPAWTDPDNDALAVANREA